MKLSSDIVRRAQRGDTAAQAEVLRACAGPVRALVRRLNGPKDVDDRMQEVLTHLLNVLPQFDVRGPAQLSTWAYTVTHRALLMHRRKRHLEVVSLDAAREVADGRPGVDRELERKQLQALVDRAVDELPEQQRRIFVMAQLHEVPLQAIADAEGLPLGTVKSRLHRAKAELTAKLGTLLDDEDDDAEGGANAAHG